MTLGVEEIDQAPISERIPATLVDPTTPILRQSVGTRWVYSPDDPLAVSVEFNPDDPTGQNPTWVFGRDLVRDGLDAYAGDGDGRLHLALGEPTLCVTLVLSSPDGMASFLIPSRRLRDFIAKTYQIVNPEKESVLLGQHLQRYLEDLIEPMPNAPEPAPAVNHFRERTGRRTHNRLLGFT